MDDFTAVFAASMVVMLLIALLFFTTLKKALELEKRLVR
ncbi:hypothetical protein Arcve_1448 [Archaeoglobus veneficus SNP6]|uniref:Uncharacterized protein n=1 Tax=Archaeoglobus veneficus (strain DSM 11195 / SNP6) TaxID=693661 RepID=F2KNX4_ARCVS|nr:hypothetical protein Arcve_1448 [Archaeoglobus veneficus SNP6]